MKIFMLIAILLALLGCEEEQQAAVEAEPVKTKPSEQTKAELEEGLPPVGHGHGAVKSKALDATVVETFDASTYTYVRAENEGGEFWLAGPRTDIAIGDKIHVTSGTDMRDFHSPTLNRTFEQIIFVESFFQSEAEAGATDTAMPHSGGTPLVTKIDVPAIAHNGDELSIAELYAQRQSRAGTTVKIRGQVVKFNSQIMGTNWIHLQDGSGSEQAGDHDLTLRTMATPEIGTTLTFSGRVEVDRDFGSGYFYPLIIEEAEPIGD